MRAPKLILSGVLALVSPSFLGCGWLSGVDEYSVSGSSGDAGPLSNPCGALQVVTEEGNCVGVGVLACAEGFESDGEGGCRAILPDIDCSIGQRAPLGSTTCARALTCSKDDLFPLAPLPDPARTRYVDANAVPGGDGTDTSHAFRTLKAGVAALPDGGYLLIKGGEYRENVVVTQSDLWIMGCAGETRLVGETAVSGSDDPCRLDHILGFGIVTPRAALCISPRAANIRIVGLDVSGPGDGMAIVGAENVRLDRVAIQTTDHIGLRIEQAPNLTRASASADLEQVLVEQTTGVGIYIAGGRVTITDSTVRNTRPRHHAEARGVSIHSSGFFGPADDPAAMTPAEVTIVNSQITGHAEAAVVAAGANVRIEGSLLGNLNREVERGRGLVAQRAIPLGVRTDVRVKSSVIQRTRDAAVDVLSASVTLEDTTVRDTLHGFEPGLPESAAVEGCSGQGVRVRSLPLPPDDPSPGGEVSLERSTVTDNRQAAVLAVASRVTLHQALLTRSTADGTSEACRRTTGNGLVLESLPEQPAEATVENTLITKHERSGIASGWGSLQIASSVLCDNGRNLVVAGGGTPAGARCGCGESLPACDVERELFESWLALGEQSAFPERSAAWEAQLAGFFPAGGAPQAHWSIWDLDHPEVPPVLSDADGHFRLAYLGGMSRPALWRSDGAAAAQHVQTASGRFQNIFSTTLSFTTPQALDWNRGWFWVSGIPSGACATTDRGPIAILRQDLYGVEPLEVRCASGVRAAVASNQDPGWITVKLSLPSGTTCDPNAALSGLPVEGDPNALRAKLERGVIVNVAFACSSASR